MYIRKVTEPSSLGREEPVIRLSGQNAAQGLPMDRCIKAHLLLGWTASLPCPEAAISVRSHRPFFATWQHNQQLSLTQDDAEIIRPRLVRTIVSRVARPLRWSLELSRPGVFL